MKKNAYLPIKVPPAWLKLIDAKTKNRSDYVRELIKRDLFCERRK